MVRGLLTSLVRSSDYSPGTCCGPFVASRVTQAALLPEMATLDLVTSVPRLDVPVLMVQGRLDQVAPGDAAQQLCQPFRGTEQGTRVVRELGAYASSRGAREVSRTPHEGPRRSACQHLSCDQSPAPRSMNTTPRRQKEL